MSASQSLRALLTNSIDFAGLFPPATLPLESALKNFAADLRSENSWMLSTFVLPVAKFAEASSLSGAFDAQHPLRISALGAKTINHTDFAEELRKVGNAVRELSGEGSDFVLIEQLEMPLPKNFDQTTFSAAGEIALRSFWEAPADDAEKTIQLLAERNASGSTPPIGFKLRTGGVTVDAFPSSAQIARALLAAAKHKVPIKFTAGLHHPVRMFRGEVKTKMHGFLNVLGAGVLAIEHGWDEEQAITMLEDEDATAFNFTPEYFCWRDFQIETCAIEKHRAVITSFGSCSFDEPRDDLRSLRLL